MNNDNRYRQLEDSGVSRRDFMKFCTGLAVTLGLGSIDSAQAIAAAFTDERRPPVIWIGAQECTGCSESLLRATHPTLETLLLQTISLEYHEVLCAAAGEQVEANKHRAMEEYRGKYVLVVDGSIPTKDGGVYCMVAGKPIIEHILEAAEGAAAIIAIGSCSAWGGVPSVGVNPTGAKSLADILPDKTVVNLPGCPPNPAIFLATVAQLITYKTLPELDSKNRPKFAYGRLIHEHCERRPHFDAGRFAEQYGDKGHRAGWCLYKLGCKGPETWGNCPSLEFCDIGGGIWPVGIGHPCIGCNEQGVGFTKEVRELAYVQRPTPVSIHPNVDEVEGGERSSGAIALLGGVGGLVAGVSLMTVGKLGRQQKSAKEKDTDREEQ